MKYLLALFMVSMTLQPLALQACAMADDQQAVQHAAMNDHGDSECCSTDSTDHPAIDCSDAAHCASLSLGFLVIPQTAGALQPPFGHKYFTADGDSYSGPPAPPLFRPPIA